jgi:hypothetical protein
MHGTYNLKFKNWDFYVAAVMIMAKVQKDCILSEV